ncbi:MAG: SH3 domain-containing protein [Pirellulales bacterium]|nr:SH3 domain-containing protein [Pirellulales bacterium]
MPPRIALAALIALLVASAPLAAQEFPYVGYIQRDDVYLRSGPGKNYYATTRLYEGDTVEVYRHDPGGWCAVRPPQGSFSWVLATQVRLLDGQRGVVQADDVVARVGTEQGDTRDVIQVRLDRGEEVVVLEAQQFGEGPKAVTWFKIAPPAGEFRWISAADLAPEPSGEEYVEEPAPHEAEMEQPAGDEEPAAPRRLKPIAARPISGAASDAEEFVADEEDEPAPSQRAKKKSANPRPAQRKPAPLDQVEEEDVEATRYEEAYADEADEVRKQPQRRPSRSAERKRPARQEYNDEYDAEESYESLDDERYDDQVAPAQYQTPSEKSRARREEAAAKIRHERIASRQKYERDHADENIYPPRVPQHGDREGDHESTELPPGAALEEIDLALSRMVTAEPQRWKLQPLKLRAEEILAQSSTAVERGRARLLVGRIERFEDVQMRAKSLGSAQASLEARRGRVDQVREARRATPAADDVNASRYDGVGKLAQIESNKPGGASYALVDSAGRVRSYVTPAPGVNLRHYLGHNVGISGTQGYLPDADRHHVTARRITVLDGRTLR